MDEQPATMTRSDVAREAYTLVTEGLPRLSLLLISLDHINLGIQVVQLQAAILEQLGGKKRRTRSRKSA